MDLFVVPTVGFDLLYASIIVRSTAELVWINSQQIRTAGDGLHATITEAFPG